MNLKFTVIRKAAGYIFLILTLIIMILMVHFMSVDFSAFLFPYVRLSLSRPFIFNGYVCLHFSRYGIVCDLKNPSAIERMRRLKLLICSGRICIWLVTSASLSCC